MPPVVFPIGAYRKELAADHLDRLLGKSILDWFIHKGRVAEDGDSRGTDQPEDRRDRGGPDTQRHGHDQQPGIELGGVEASNPQFQVAPFQLPDAVQTSGDQDDDKEQDRVREQAVDAQHHKDHGIVAREVGQVVVHATLDLAEIGRLGKTFEIQEFGNRAEVGKAGANGLGTDAVEAITKSRGDRIDGDLDGAHAGGSTGGMRDGVTRLSPNE